MSRSMIIKGKVTSKERFFGLLHALAESSKTGTLVVVDGDVERRLFFENGKIVSTASSTTIESFGHFLLERAFIQESTLSQLKSKPDALLGQELVEIGAMTEDEVQQALRLKIKATLTDIYSSPESTFEFAKESLGDKRRISIAFDVLELMTAEGITEEPEAREFRVDTEQTDRFEAVRDEAVEERTVKEEATKEEEAKEEEAKEETVEDRTDKFEAVKDDDLRERTDKYVPVKEETVEKQTDKHEEVKDEVVEDQTDKYEPVIEQTQKFEAAPPKAKSQPAGGSVEVGEDSLLEAFEKIKKIKTAKSREEKKEPALPLIPVPTGPIRKSKPEEPATEAPEDTEATIAETPTDNETTIAEAPAKLVEKPQEEPPAPASVEPEEVAAEVEEDVPVVVEDEVEEDVPVVVEDEDVPVVVEEEAPVVVEDEVLEVVEEEAPVVVEDEVPEVVEEEAPVVVEDEVLEVVQDEAPIVVEDEVPEVVEDEDIPADSGDTIPGDIDVVDEEVVQEPVMAARDTDSTIGEQPESVLPAVEEIVEEIIEETVEEPRHPVFASPPSEEPEPIETPSASMDTESTLREFPDVDAPPRPEPIEEPVEKTPAAAIAPTVDDADMGGFAAASPSETESTLSERTEESSAKLQELLNKTQEEPPSPEVLEPTLSEPAVEAPKIAEPEIPAPVAPRPREPKPAPAPVTTPIAKPGQVIPKQDSSKLPLIGAAIFAVVLLSLGGFIFFGGSGGNESAEERGRTSAPSSVEADDTPQVAESGVGDGNSDQSPQQTAPPPAQAAPPPTRAPAKRASEPVRRETERTAEAPTRTPPPQEPPPSRPVVESPKPAQPPPSERSVPDSSMNMEQAQPVVDEGTSTEPAPSQPEPEPEPPPAATTPEPTSPPPAAKAANNAGQQQPAATGWNNAIFAPQPKINVAPKNEQPTVQRGALVESGSDVIDPVLMEHPELEYPKEAKKEKIQTVVQVRVLVDENGNVIDAKIDKPVGYGLDEAALKVARAARFMPATKGSVQVKMWTTLPLAYRLK